jgi:hypothetical protein
MAYFAKLDENNNVIHVINVDNSCLLTADKIESEEQGISWLINWSGGYTNWKQTSYNSKKGVHYDPETNLPSGKPAFRKNYAVLGGVYDPVRDAFIPPKPYPSAVLNEETCDWDHSGTLSLIPVEEFK